MKHTTAQHAFKSLADCLALDADDLFFSRLAERLAAILGVDHLFVSRLLPVGTESITLALWSNGALRENLTYTLAGTPCAHVTQRTACYYAQGVCHTFPDDVQLATMGVDAYLGVPIVASDGTFLGVIAAMHSHPLGDAALAEEILRIAASRVGAELMRLETARALNESELRLQNLMSHLPGMVYRCHNDEYWTMEFVSDGALELTGYPAEDFIGNHRRTFGELVHPDDRLRLVDEVQKSLASGTAYTLTYRITTASGETRWLWEQGKAVQDHPGRLLDGFICDITADVQADQTRELHERQLTTANRALALLSQCNERLVHADDETVLLQDICQLAVEVGGYRMAWVGYAQDDAKRSIRLQASAGETAGYLEEFQLSWSADDALGYGPSGRALRSGTLQIVNDIANDPNCAPWRAIAQKTGYQSIISLPLKNSSGPFGVLVLYQADTTPFSEEEQRLLCDLADDLAFGIEALQTRQRQARIQHAVLQIATAVSSRSGEAYFQQLAQHMASALGASAGVIARTLPTTSIELETLAAYIEGRWIEPVRYALPDTPCHKVMLEGEYLSNNCIAEQMAAAAQEAMPWIKAYAGKRLDNTAGKPVGLLFVAFREPIVDPGFVHSILKIFAAGAAAELERLEDETRIRRLAYIDGATELPNRTAFREHLDTVLKRRSPRLSLLFLDLNRFKEINDIHGHDMGDYILAAAAIRFRQALSGNEFLARLGGDEFVVMLEHAETQDAMECARRLQSALDAPFLAMDQSFQLEVSIGIANYPDHATSARELLQHADIAMYQAKQQATRYCVYQASMGQVMAARLEMAKRLAHAIEHDRLQLYYQAQVNIADGRLIGAEALCRWQDEELGWVSPGEFIPLAEARGMIKPLGDWVIETACRQLAAWREQRAQLPGQLAVNVASQQLDDTRLTQKLDTIRQRHDIEPQALSLELTESSFMSDPEQAIAMANALKALGYGLAIDDFGTGYSSLAHLKRFPADKIKIDISFIRDMLSDNNDFTIVKTIIAMARSLGLDTIAEGIESPDQAEALLALGCEQAQGFLYARPLPADEFRDTWLRESAILDAHQESGTRNTK
ncbi:EAL domain-containing protein [Litchfieldella xinjiangensis]|uniref:EAL domain-containing protein n=1 Tax=Litchfieldella xinjiangensis TaxID=1166948 RepID=UPI0006933A22|nr:EAL domain-containing protein [Halomonas xinjiangensis]